VEIQLTATDDDMVEFKQSGSPFTAKALFGLSYQYSKGKQIRESTRHFGISCLTTRCPSTIVSVSGDMYTDDINSSLVGLSGTNRKGFRRALRMWKRLLNFMRTEPSGELLHIISSWNHNE
jgi:hypothetical protein